MQGKPQNPSMIDEDGLPDTGAWRSSMISIFLKLADASLDLSRVAWSGRG